MVISRVIFRNPAWFSRSILISLRKRFKRSLIIEVNSFPRQLSRVIGR